MERLVTKAKKFFRFGDSNTDDIKTSEEERIAINPSGGLGSYYDGLTDAMQGKTQTKFKSYNPELRRSIKCEIYPGRTGETQNLLQMVDVDQPLRLSLLSKMIQPSGIASIIDYPRPIDRHTRFLYFCCETRRETCHEDWLKRTKSHQIPMSVPLTTWMLTEIISGIHVVVVLQLPSDQHGAIDHILEQMRDNLIDDKRYPIELTPEKMSVLNHITSTIVYSNISSLTELTNIYDIWKEILHMRDDYTEHCPLKFHFSTVQPPHLQQDDGNETNSPSDLLMSEEFENNLLRQRSQFRVLQLRLDQELPILLQNKLAERLNTVRQSFLEIKNLYDNNLKQIQDLIKHLRQNQNDLKSIDEVLNSDVQQTIQDSIQRLTLSLGNLSTKGNLIKKLQENEFEYWDVSNSGIDHQCSEQLVKDILFKNPMEKLIFCANDKLKQQSTQDWDRLHTQMIEERHKNPQLNLIYADFTYSTWCLGEMVVLSSKQQTLYIDQSHSHLTSQQVKRKAPPPPSKSNDKYINILLLGESGVGKSTFINAFANYLYFESLKQAQHGQPVVVIPVSFVMTTNDSFDEQVVKFGEVDPNENHANTGQSVTQQCRAYVFDIAHQKKLRIIDTPGFGDTRGSQQDDNNMNIIFSFLNNVTHLNAICLLLKPNVGQLNPYLHSCLIQLFDYFGEDIRNRIVFCFTNARSTFFAPGDTRPLLQSLLDSLRVKKIVFEKENTFCFDSESFRYLVALQNGLIFNDVERDEYEQSWRRSAEESNRLRTYFCENLHPYYKSLEWQSIRDAQFQITRLIRPMLESIRNILRNVLLHDNNCSIKLMASPVDRLSEICYAYDRTVERFGDFWIFSDYLSPLLDICDANGENLTEYRLGYEFLHDQTLESIEVLKEQKRLLYAASSKFTHFLITTQTRQDDPFLLGLTRMIEEEEFICQKHNQSIWNRQLVDALKTLKNEYEEVFKQLYPDDGDQMLPTIYKLIVSLSEVPTMKKQIDAIKVYQQHLVTSSERNIDQLTTRF